MSRPTRHRNKWRVRWLDEHGRRRSACFSSYTDAERALRRHQADVDAIRAGIRDPVAEQNADRTFDDLAAYWLE